MKHKTLKRVLCFLLALVVVASMPLDIHANAVAIELGWMTWVLVSAMTAMGFSFVASGGIDALQSAVEDAVDEYDEYRQTIGFNRGLYENLDDKLLFGGGGGQDPNLGNRFWLTAAGVVAVAEFIDWVQNNAWGKNNTIQTSEQNYCLNGNYELNGVPVNLAITWQASNVYPYYPLLRAVDGAEGSIDLTSYNVGTVLKVGDILTIPSYPVSGYTAFGFQSADTIILYNVDSSNNETIDCSSLLDWAGVTTSDVEGFIVGFAQYSNGRYIPYLYVLLNDGRAVCRYWGTYSPYFGSSSYDFLNLTSLEQNSATITSPSTVTEFDVQEGQALELDFRTFENEAQFQSPEELADAIKNNIIDTGTVPDVSPSIVADPSVTPQPSPVPSPVPSQEPPTYEDIDDLGLPTLGKALQNKFPFCLPYDLGRVFEIFYAEPVAPYWEVDLFATLGNRVPFVGDTSFTIDLAEYDELGVISRWMTTIGYVLLLILITRQTTKW